VLIVVENRNPQILQAVLNLKTPRCRDIFKVNPAKNRRDPADRFDNLSRVLGVKADGPSINARELLE